MGFAHQGSQKLAAFPGFTVHACSDETQKQTQGWWQNIVALVQARHRTDSLHCVWPGMLRNPGSASNTVAVAMVC